MPGGKVATLDRSCRQQLIDPGYDISIRRQCELFKVNRSGYYYRPHPTSDDDVELMRQIDEIYLELPFYGSRRIPDELATRGFRVNRKRCQRLMRTMGIQAVYPKPRTTVRQPAHTVYPYFKPDNPAGLS